MSALTTSKWWPTNKWWSATVVTLGTIVLLLVNGDGINTDVERTTLVSLVVARIVAYVTRNDSSAAA